MQFCAITYSIRVYTRIDWQTRFAATFICTNGYNVTLGHNMFLSL